MHLSEFDQVIERYHGALREFCLSGNPEPAQEMYSHRDDASLGNPFGPFVRGWKQVAETTERAAAHYGNGEQCTFERVAEFATPDLRYILATVALRATTIFRTEDGAWRIVHRMRTP